jgi:branched-chain amino acid transport system substrate-binding protein
MGPKRVLASACAAIALATLSASAAGAQVTTSSREAAKKPIVIGAAVALTGFIYQIVDQANIRGMQLAVKHFNSHGGAFGRKLKLVYGDTKSQISGAKTAADEVLAKGAKFVLTTCDYNFGGPAAIEANSKGVAAFGCAGDSLFGYHGIGPLTYNSDAGTGNEGAVMAQFAKSKGWKRAYVLEDTTLAYSKTQCDNFAKAFHHDGGTMVGTDTFQQGDPSIATQIARYQSTNPKPAVLALCSYMPGAASALRQVRAAGIKVPILGGTEWEGNYWLSSAGGTVNKLYHVGNGALFGDDPNPAINKLFKKYRKTYGATPHNTFSLFGYQNVADIVSALKADHGNTKGSAITKVLDKWRNHSTLLGPTTYTKTCHVPLHRPLKVMEWKNNHDHYLKTIAPKWLPPGPC